MGGTAIALGEPYIHSSKIKNVIKSKNKPLLITEPEWPEVFLLVIFSLPSPHPYHPSHHHPKTKDGFFNFQNIFKIEGIFGLALKISVINPINFTCVATTKTIFGNSCRDKAKLINSKTLIQ